MSLNCIAFVLHYFSEDIIALHMLSSHVSIEGNNFPSEEASIFNYRRNSYSPSIKV